MHRHPKGFPAALAVMLGLACGLAPTARSATAQSAAHRCNCPSPAEIFDRRPAQPVPGAVGHETLGAIQEVTGLLLSDPATDWRRVSLHRLRQYLVDVDLVLTRARVAEQHVPGGVLATVTGDADVLAAARRLLPIHVRRTAGFRDWRATVEDGADGLRVRLVADDRAEVPVVRGLGLFGFLASGVHHPHQLLAVARGAGDPTAGADAGGG